MTTAAATTPHRPAAAALWMLGAVAAFTLMAMAGRAAGRGHDPFEIMLYRSLLGLSVLAVFVAATGRRAELRLRRPGLMTLRNLFHFGGQILWLHAITVLPLALVFALEFTTPVWVLLLSPLVLAEPMTRRGAVVTALGLAGVLIVTRPWALGLSPGVAAAALCAVGFAVSAITTRALTRTEPILSVLVWMHVMQAGFALVAAGADGTIALPDATTALPLAAVGLLGLTAQVSLTSALSLAPAAQAMPVDFLRLPLIALAGWAVYGETLDAPVLAGGAVILAANWLNLSGRPAPPR